LVPVDDGQDLSRKTLFDRVFRRCHDNLVQWFENAVFVGL
jgi:hypothetical protein